MALATYRRFVGRLAVAFTALPLATAVAALTSLSVGVVAVPLDALLGCALGPATRDASCIVLSLRATRTIASLVAGASLGVAGTLVQGITRNPLAEPYILGLSSAALATAALAILLNPSVAASRDQLVAHAFAGAMLALALTLLLSRLGRSDLSIVLAGVAVTAVFSGIAHITLYLIQTALWIPYVYLLMGSTSAVLWDDLKLMTAIFAISTAVAVLMAKPLNAYTYGSEYARQLGYNPRAVAVASAIVAGLLTGGVVATAGIVGFVGLAAPHVARFLVGSDHRFAIPASALVGATMVTASDVAVRLASRGFGELPLGVMTSILGAPILAYLVLRRFRYGASGYGC